ncbi:MAG: DUF433 domain-containing protein [Isosphaeraceae bacterium]
MKLVARPPRLNARMKAEVLLEAESGAPDEQIAERLGIPVHEVGLVVTAYRAGGLEALGLARLRLPEERPRRRLHRSRIVKTPGVCGGSARITGTRIPVWQLVEERKLGASEAQLLNDYRTLRAQDLVAAWDYAEQYADEIDGDIRRNALG